MKMFKRYIPIVLLIMHCLLIAFFSAQGSEKSTEASRGVMEVVLEAGNSEPEDFTKPQLDKVEYVVRKCAHFVLYLILGIYAYLSADVINIKQKLSASLAFCLLYAILDELQQFFSLERSGQMSDICLDFVSSLAGAVLTLFVIKKLQQVKTKHD